MKARDKRQGTEHNGTVTNGSDRYLARHFLHRSIKRHISPDFSAVAAEDGCNIGVKHLRRHWNHVGLSDVCRLNWTVPDIDHRPVKRLLSPPRQIVNAHLLNPLLGSFTGGCGPHNYASVAEKTVLEHSARGVFDVFEGISLLDGAFGELEIRAPSCVREKRRELGKYNRQLLGFRAHARRFGGGGHDRL